MNELRCAVSDGPLLTEAQYRAGRLDGQWLGQSADGHLVVRGAYRAGVRDGVWRVSSHGKLVEHREYRAGRRDGTWFARDEAGQLLWRGHFRAGAPAGGWTCLGTQVSSLVQGDLTFADLDIRVVHPWLLPADPPALDARCAVAGDEHWYGEDFLPGER